jgi:hypothetical protein
MTASKATITPAIQGLILGHVVFSSPRYLTQTLKQRLVIAGQKTGHFCPKKRLRRNGLQPPKAHIVPPSRA